MKQKNSLSIRILCLCFLLLALPACQQTVTTDYSKLDLATVNGNVAVAGTPLANAYIMFEAEDHTYSFGKTDASGNYTLMFNTEKEGILPGPKTVRIRTSGAFGAEGEMIDGQEEDLDEGQAPSKSGNSESLPETYHKESHLNVVVESGSQSFDFDLKKDGSTKTSI